MLVVREGADPEKRARLLGAGDALNEATGSPFRLVERAPGGIGVGLREPLEREEFRTAYPEGRSLSFQDVVALALEVLDEFSPRPSDHSSRYTPAISQQQLVRKDGDSTRRRRRGGHACPDRRADCDRGADTHRALHLERAAEL